jgi:outer membrane lipoprotein SlyB
MRSAAWVAPCHRWPWVPREKKGIRQEKAVVGPESGCAWGGIARESTGGAAGTVREAMAAGDVGAYIYTQGAERPSGAST